MRSNQSLDETKGTIRWVFQYGPSMSSKERFDIMWPMGARLVLQYKRGSNPAFNHFWVRHGSDKIQIMNISNRFYIGKILVCDKFLALKSCNKVHLPIALLCSNSGWPVIINKSTSTILKIQNFTNENIRVLPR